MANKLTTLIKGKALRSTPSGLSLWVLEQEKKKTMTHLIG